MSEETSTTPTIVSSEADSGPSGNHQRNSSTRSSIHDTVTPKTMGGNLFFNIGGGEDEDEEELAQLEKGKEYEATVIS
jgi:hypothetical protein